MKLLRAICFALFALSLSATALAQEEDPAESRATSFEAARGARTENVPGGALMVGAYGAALTLLLLYVVSLGFRQARTMRELERLREELAAHEGKSATDES